MGHIKKGPRSWGLRAWAGARALFAGAVLGALAPAQTAAEGFEEIGDALQLAVPLYSLYASYDLNGRNGLYGCGAGLAATVVSTRALKPMINQRRPNGGGAGMPSGHTSASAVGFGCMLGQEGWTGRTVALGVATAITGFTRVESFHHDWKQVGAGLALGTAFGYYSTLHLRDSWSVTYDAPMSGGQTIGVRMDF